MVVLEESPFLMYSSLRLGGNVSVWRPVNYCTISTEAVISQDQSHTLPLNNLSPSPAEVGWLILYCG